jgi:hypothetical protein
MHVLAYNLTRVMNIVGAQPLMAAMRAGAAFGRLLYNAPKVPGKLARKAAKSGKAAISTQSRNITYLPRRLDTTKTQSGLHSARRKAHVDCAAAPRLEPVPKSGALVWLVALAWAVYSQVAETIRPTNFWLAWTTRTELPRSPPTPNAL